MSEATKTRNDVEKELVLKAWEDEEFKQRLVSDPKAAITEMFGVEIPDAIDVKVVEEDLQTLYVRLPMKPVTEDELTDEQLEAVAGGACVPVLGVAVIALGMIAASATMGAGLGVGGTLAAQKKLW